MIQFHQNEPLKEEAFEILGFCACGRPSYVLEYIRAGLQFIHDNFNERDLVWTYDQYKQTLVETFGNEAAAALFFYWADKEGFTDHGGEVPGRLEFNGHNLLDLLNRINRSV